MKNREFSCSKVKNREHLHPADRLMVAVLTKTGTQSVSLCFGAVTQTRCKEDENIIKMYDTNDDSVSVISQSLTGCEEVEENPSNAK